MIAAILSIGDELTSGITVDTNAAWMARRLLSLGVSVAEVRQVPDDRAAIARCIADLASRAQVLFVSGGLGPTPDDLTREALGDAIAPGEPLEVDPAGIAHVEASYRRAGRFMPNANRRQALRPRLATLLDNPNGTAPGLRARLGLCEIVCMPGVPREMKAMFDSVAPTLAPRSTNRAMIIRSVHLVGLGESAVAERLGSILNRDRLPRVGTGVSDFIVSLRIYSEGTPEQASRAADATADEIEGILRPFVFGRDRTTLAESVISALGHRGWSMCSVESCTGGMIGAMVTDIPGSSDVFRGGWITYSNDLKTGCVDVPPDILARHGAVSRETAEAMVRGGMARSGSQAGVSVTGIAGPSGGSDLKPVGTVFIGRGLRRTDGTIDVAVKRFRFFGDRASVRLRASLLAMQIVRLGVLGIDPGEPLLGEVLEHDGR
jgi:nicotinamide-nucleotide amidase